jgi:hypothetical protein
MISMLALLAFAPVLDCEPVTRSSSSELRACRMKERHVMSCVGIGLPEAAPACRGAYSTLLSAPCSLADQQACIAGVAYILHADVPASFEEARRACQAAHHGGGLAAPGSAEAVDSLLAWLLQLDLAPLPSLQVAPGITWSNTTGEYAPSWSLYAAGARAGSSARCYRPCVTACKRCSGRPGPTQQTQCHRRRLKRRLAALLPDAGPWIDLYQADSSAWLSAGAAATAGQLKWCRSEPNNR